MNQATSSQRPLEAILRVDRMSKTFGRLHRWPLMPQPLVVRAVDDVSFSLMPGESFGVVGESGSGKTTVARLLTRLEKPDAGTILYQGRDVSRLVGGELLSFRHDVQMIFQNPHAAMNPRRPIQDILAVGLEIHGGLSSNSRKERIVQTLGEVGISREVLTRYPHQLSGGQLQRIGIARALVVSPSVIIADEPVSSVDVSIQAQVLNLLKDLQREHRMTFLMISHDLRVINFACDRIGVMYFGRLVEVGQRTDVLGRPLHPYTVALMSSVPLGPTAARHRTRVTLSGEIGDTLRPKTGCVFAPRCWLRRELGDPEECTVRQPELRELPGVHAVACHFAERTGDQAGTSRAVSDMGR